MGTTNFDAVAASDFSGNITGNVTGELTGTVKLTTQAITADGAITLKSGLVILNKAGAIAATLAAPTATTDDGKELNIVSITAQAHTVTVAGGINGTGASGDVGTFGGAIGDGFTVIAYGGKWYQKTNTNVTFA